MAIKQGFFNSVLGDREYNNEDFARLVSLFVTDGVFSTHGQLFTTRAAGEAVTVDTGFCWFNHAWLENTNLELIEVEPGSTGLDRYDAIVVEINHVREVRAASLKVVKGESAPEGYAVHPTMIHNADVNQYALAYIFRPADSTTVLDQYIEMMPGKTETPFATGILTQVDISTLFVKWDGYFYTWFNHLKNELDANQAANLQRQIDELRDSQIITEPVTSTVSGSTITFVLTEPSFIPENGRTLNLYFGDIPNTVDTFLLQTTSGDITVAFPITNNAGRSYAGLIKGNSYQSLIYMDQKWFIGSDSVSGKTPIFFSATLNSNEPLLDTYVGGVHVKVASAFIGSELILTHPGFNSINALGLVPVGDEYAIKTKVISDGTVSMGYITESYAQDRIWTFEIEGDFTVKGSYASLESNPNTAHEYDFIYIVNLLIY